MKRKINIALCILLLPIIVLTSFFGYFIAERINNKEVSTGKYSASAMIFVNYTTDTHVEEDQNNKMSASAVSPSTTLAENFTIICRYSEDMLSLIPGGYSVSIKPFNETNILSIDVVGANPNICIQTANNLAQKSPEVMAEYYSDGNCTVVNLATDATHIEKTKLKDVLTILFTCIGFLIGVIWYLSMIFIDISYRKKHSIVPDTNTLQEANL